MDTQQPIAHLLPEVDPLAEWEGDYYPKAWRRAWALGRIACEEGHPKECNLTEEQYVHNGKILKVYRSAWEQGWDGIYCNDIVTEWCRDFFLNGN